MIPYMKCSTAVWDEQKIKINKRPLNETFNWTSSRMCWSVKICFF